MYGKRFTSLAAALFLAFLFLSGQVDAQVYVPPVSAAACAECGGVGAHKPSCPHYRSSQEDSDSKSSSNKPVTRSSNRGDEPYSDSNFFGLIDGKPLSELPLSAERWAEIKHMTTQGGSNIIKLRGRSSFQSPAYQAVKMIEGAMGGEPFTWPAGCYVNCDKCGFKNVMMAMPSVIDKDGVHFTAPEGTAEEMAALQASYEHLQKMRDEIIGLGIIPAVTDWGKDNPNL